MIILAEKHSAGENAKRYNASESSEVAAIIMGVEDGEVGARNIVLRKKSAITRNRNPVLDVILISHHADDPPPKLCTLAPGRKRWMVPIIGHGVLRRWYPYCKR